ncbi:hypothetical protein BMETH_2908_0 [methanotrophic bacterial endosymbiont of Bathymodiolus sp.]|nr:hypothetical protein BMETH_2908_0 [methanotrophic bacterial endosymbiont of Bathymodiolus sp.]
MPLLTRKILSVTPLLSISHGLLTYLMMLEWRKQLKIMARSVL